MSERTLGRDERTGQRWQLQVLVGEHEQTARAIIAKYPNKRSATLPLLFLVQSIEGYVTEAGMRDVAELLELTPAEVLAAGSFYTMLKRTPTGEYLVSVCRNISCTHNGSRAVIKALQQRLGVSVGETTRDGRFTLEAAECLATCEGAPAAQINYEDIYNLTAEHAAELVDRLERGEQVTSVRGDAIKTHKEVSREIALAGVRDARFDGAARVVGGESPPVDMAPGFRPKEPGGHDAGEVGGG